MQDPEHDNGITCNYMGTLCLRQADEDTEASLVCPEPAKMAACSNHFIQLAKSIGNWSALAESAKISP